MLQIRRMVPSGLQFPCLEADIDPPPHSSAADHNPGGGWDEDGDGEAEPDLTSAIHLLYPGSGPKLPLYIGQLWMPSGIAAHN